MSHLGVITSKITHLIVNFFLTHFFLSFFGLSFFNVSVELVWLCFSVYALCGI